MGKLGGKLLEPAGERLGADCESAKASAGGGGGGGWAKEAWLLTSGQASVPDSATGAGAWGSHPAEADRASEGLAVAAWLVVLVRFPRPMPTPRDGG